MSRRGPQMNGVFHTKAEVLYAVQEPTAASLFGERTTAAAWHSKPSWYAVSKLDQTINPDLERFLAKRMNATTVELNAGHLSLVSHPKEIADLISGAPKNLHRMTRSTIRSRNIRVAIRLQAVTRRRIQPRASSGTQNGLLTERITMSAPNISSFT